MSEQAVIQFTADGRRTTAYYLKHHGEPHFVYEFLAVLQAYKCDPEEAPARFAQLVGNFLGPLDGIQPWDKYDDFLRDHGMYFVEVHRRPWRIERRILPSAESPYQWSYDALTDKQIQEERRAAQKHSLVASGALRRFIRDRNDQHFLPASQIRVDSAPQQSEKNVISLSDAMDTAEQRGPL